MVKMVPVTVEALPEYTGLDGENADNYYKACQRNALLSSEIITPFRTALKEHTGYDDENRPNGEVEVPCDIGDFRFCMKVTPTAKRPGYKDVFEEVYFYLSTRLDEYKASERPVGVWTIEDEPYVSAEDILAMMNKMKRRIKSKGVKIEITDPELPAGNGSMVLPLGADTSELTEGNAGRYLEARSMAERYAGFISGFEEELLGFTGYGNDHPPEQAEHMFRHIGRHIFHVASVPYESTCYGKIIAGLNAKPGKKKVETGGDLVLVTKNIEIPRLKMYKARQREGEHLIRLKGLLKRMDKLMEDKTDTKVRQKPILHYPIV